ncbi:Gpi-anchored elicitin inl11b-like protein, partial [Globisporangium splendens]
MERVCHDGLVLPTPFSNGQCVRSHRAQLFKEARTLTPLGKAAGTHSAIRTLSLKSPNRQANMTKSSVFTAISLAMLASIVSAHGDESHSGSGSVSHSGAVGECDSTVSALVIAAYTNGTFYSTCASGKTFKITTLADVEALSSTDFAAFCGSANENCLEPLHNVVHHAPTDCLVNYEGKDQDLRDEIIDLHDKCHALLDAEAAASHSTTSGSTASSTSTVSTPTPSPTSSAASVSTKALAFAVGVCATVTSFVM